MNYRNLWGCVRNGTQNLRSVLENYDQSGIRLMHFLLVVGELKL